MKVKLTYFKDSGKYYCNGSYDTSKKALWEIFREVEELQKSKHLPGVVTGTFFKYVLIDVPEHPHRHPHLCIREVE